MSAPLQINLQKPRDGRLLADTFTLMVPDTEDWHGSLVDISLRDIPLGTARVTMAVPFLAEKLSDKSAMITLGLAKIDASALYMREFGGIHPNTKLVYISLKWETRDLANIGTYLFNDQWAKLVEERESQIQNEVA